jgi:hypothetical protein
MYVITKHQIKDADAFFAAARMAAEGAPPGVYGRQFCPSRDGAEAVCLWEADSLEAVREYLDSLIGETSDNAYFEVDTRRAIGMPDRIEAGAQA